MNWTGKKIKTEVNKLRWHPWFAWYPVRVDNGKPGETKKWVWREWVERRFDFLPCPDGEAGGEAWFYKEKVNGEVQKRE